MDISSDSEKTSGKQRIYKYDNLKFLLILLVVIGHFIDIGITEKADKLKSIFIFIYSFHMPLFIFISGLFQNKNFNKIGKKIFAYITLGFMLKVLISLCNMLFSDKYEFSLLSDYTVPWFLFALAAFILLCYALRNVKPVYVLIPSILIALFVGYDSSIGDWLYLSRIVVFFPFYYAGFCLTPQKVMNALNRLYIKIISAVVILGYVLICILKLDIIYKLRVLFTGRNSYSALENPQTGALYRIAAYVISIILCIAFIAIIPNIKIPIITSFGRRTLQVYFWHCAVVWAFEAYEVTEVFHAVSSYAGLLVYLLIALAVTLILSLRVFGLPVNKFLNPMKEQKTASRRMINEEE